MAVAAHFTEVYFTFNFCSSVRLIIQFFLYYWLGNLSCDLSVSLLTLFGSRF